MKTYLSTIQTTKLRQKLARNKRLLVCIILTFFLLNTSFLFLVLRTEEKDTPVEARIQKADVSYPEVNTFRGKDISFEEIRIFFKELSNEKGAPYAYEVLKQAYLPPNTDTHLLAHAVSEELYKQQGVDGMKVCTNDFRNACSHSIVIAMFQEDGESAIDDISKVCKQAPGGMGAYTMCFHGLGHGVLSYTDYNLEEAIKLCKKTGTREYHNQEYIQCVGGTIMEMISGGGHSPDVWAAMRPNYLMPENPLYPCSSIIIDEAKHMCYVYITPYLFEAVGADMARPEATDFEKAFLLCNYLPPEDQSYRTVCYGGFGKEFVVLTKDRDIRNVGTITEDQSKTVYEWCLLAKERFGIDACIEQAMQSMYWGGENKPDAAISFCSIISDTSSQRTCFVSLTTAVSYYINDAGYRSDFCSLLPENYGDSCRVKLGV